MNKVIFAQDEKTAEALKLRLPSFAEATVQIGYKGANEVIEGATVFTDYMPSNMQALTDTTLLASLNMKKKTRDKLDSEDLAEEITYIQAFKVNQIEFDGELSGF